MSSFIARLAVGLGNKCKHARTVVKKSGADGITCWFTKTFYVLKFRIQHSKPFPESFIISHKYWNGHFQNDINHKDHVESLLTLALLCLTTEKADCTGLKAFTTRDSLAEPEESAERFCF
jgi:hypothetical protein